LFLDWLARCRSYVCSDAITASIADRRAYNRLSSLSYGLAVLNIRDGFFPDTIVQVYQNV